MGTPVGIDPYRDALSWLFQQTRRGAARTPERMENLIEVLELPQPPQVIHVVGTNGKGSVTAMIAAAYQAAGWRVGRFLSPHVEDFRERIQTGDQRITRGEVVTFIARVKAMKLPVEPAFFELTLALALERFARRRVEVAVVEAGVGARGDATLALRNVAAVTITNVTEDHLPTLGPTLSDIAREKGAAIRPGIPVVTGAEGDPLDVLRAMASHVGAPLHSLSDGGPLFEIPSDGLDEERPWRRSNQALAAATLRILGQVGEPALEAGLAIPPLPARGEVFTVRGRPVVLDGAHNPGAAAALRDALRLQGLEPFFLVFASSHRKDSRKTLDQLLPGASELVLTALPGEPLRPELAPGRPAIPSPVRALRYALDHAPAGTAIVITGSFYLAGALRRYLRRNGTLPSGTPQVTRREPARGYTDASE